MITERLNQVAAAIEEAQIVGQKGRKGSDEAEKEFHMVLKRRGIPSFNMNVILNPTGKKDVRTFCDVIPSVPPEPFIFANWKSSMCKTGDNISAKVALEIAYCKVPIFNSHKDCIKYYQRINGLKDDDFVKHLRQNLCMSDNGQDYYFIIHHKKSRTCFWTSLKSLNAIRSNPSNKIQALWPNNTRDKRLSFEDNRRLVLGTWLNVYEKILEKSKRVVDVMKDIMEDIK